MGKTVCMKHEVAFEGECPYCEPATLAVAPFHPTEEWRKAILRSNGYPKYEDYMPLMVNVSDADFAALEKYLGVNATSGYITVFCAELARPKRK